ncbi:MAG: hypothetical protein Q9178_007900 [Gyalolechia marmorata]
MDGVDIPLGYVCHVRRTRTLAQTLTNPFCVVCKQGTGCCGWKRAQTCSQHTTFWVGEHWEESGESTFKLSATIGQQLDVLQPLTVNIDAVKANVDWDTGHNLLGDRVAALDGLARSRALRVGACNNVLSGESRGHDGEGDKGDDVLELHCACWEGFDGTIGLCFGVE